MQFKILFYLLLIVLLNSCKKSSDDFSPILAKDYLKFEIGKSYYYRYDSTLPANFGASLINKSFIAKDSIESSFFDALGNKSYRIYRYITDTLQKTPWIFTTTITATIKNNNIEFVENNLRFIKLSNIVNNNYSWKGNSYINTQFNSPYYYYNNWDYRYTNINQPFTSLKQIFDSTITVQQQDAAIPAVFDPTIYNEKTIAKEVYAKNVGLVYKELLFYIWQPSSQRFQDDAIGIKMNLIDYK